MSKVLVTGGRGKLGLELSKLIDAEFIDIQEVDITSKEEIQKWIRKGDYQVVFHLAADTNLNRCEKDHEWAHRVNVLSTQYIAEAVEEIGGLLVYPSTDYIFDGEKGKYREDDAPNPVNYYSMTKLLSEYIVRGVKEHLVMRGTMKERGKWRHPVAPSDMFESLLHHDEYAEFMVKLVERGARGTFHVGKGRYSVYEWAKNSDTEVQPKTIDEIGFPLPRDCSLDTTKMERFLSENPNVKIKIRKES
jgi:dTDP-4-dehydrorhamnose reductase